MSHLPANPSESFKKLNPHLFGNPNAPLVTAVSMLDKVKPRIRQSSKPLMNKLETQFMNEQLRGAGWDEILTQQFKFKLGNGVWYCPDFICKKHDAFRHVAYEVKGDWFTDDSKVKIKVAAGLYPTFIWTMAWKREGRWLYQLVLP